MHPAPPTSEDDELQRKRSHLDQGAFHLTTIRQGSLPQMRDQPVEADHFSVPGNGAVCTRWWTHVCVSSPIRACVERQLGCQVKGLRICGGERRKACGRDTHQDCACYQQEEELNQSNGPCGRKYQGSFQTVYSLDPTVARWNFVLSYGG